MWSNLLLFLVVCPGFLGTIVFGYFALIDWDALQRDYTYFRIVIENKASLETLFIAESQQNIHRINLFAEGVWTLLSAIMAAIGIHGVAILKDARKNK